MDPNKEKALDAALSQIERQFGKGTVMRMGDQERVAIPSISTGSLGLDIALGIGGLPKGRICEIYGPESSGKTTLTLQVIAEAQKAGGTAAFIDAEHALDPQYADKLGVQVDDLIVSQPDTGEQALEVAEMLVRSGAVDVLVVDSVAALTPKAEIEGEMGDSHVGLQARLLSQAMRKLTGAIKQTNCLVIFINQIRMKIGVMFGSPETTTGGNALKFYSSVRLDIQSHRGVELECISASSGFRAAKHDANLHTDLVDKDHQTVGLLDRACEFAHRLTQQTGLQAHVGIPHLALDFGFWSECCDGINHQDVNRTGPH